jgi:predicted DNA-binding transcriptional regulator AlpA
MSILDTLPPELGRHRVLGTRDTWEFVGISIPDWRRKRALGETPPAIKIGSRKLGWRLGDLIDWVASRQQTVA